ncbi:MAG: hypothetical protein ACOCP8_03665 [archaeon]
MTIRDLTNALGVHRSNAIKFENIIEQNNGLFNRIVSNYKFENKEDIERSIVSLKLIYNV